MPVPDFILRLRRHVGHDLLWLVGVTAVVLRTPDEGEHEVLLVRRADNGAWTPVTGISDPGEHPADTAVRECLEETRVSCAVEGLAHVGVTPVVTHPNGDRAQYLDHTFRCRFVEGDAHVGDDESVEVGWFPLTHLPALSTRMRARLDAALTYDGGATALVTDTHV